MSAALRAYAAREGTTRSEQRAASSGDGEAGASTAADDDAPLVGKRVTLTGLLARPDLNGQTGEAISFSSASGRYTVGVGDEQIALRATNLAVARSDSRDADAFAPQSRVRIKALVAKPELNGCGGTVIEWNEDKERFVVELDGSLQKMLLRAANLERDRRERWAPEMHTAANLAHIASEMDRKMAEQAQNASPFAQMGLEGSG